MAKFSPMLFLVLVGVVGMLNVAMACAPCTVKDFPPCLKPTIGTPLENVVCALLELLSSLVSDVTKVVALLLCVLKVVLEVLAGLGCDVKALLQILTSCYDIAKGDSALKALLDQLLKALKGVLSKVIGLVDVLLGGLLG